MTLRKACLMAIMSPSRTHCDAKIGLCIRNHDRSTNAQDAQDVAQKNTYTHCDIVTECQGTDGKYFGR